MQGPWGSMSTMDGEMKQGDCGTKGKVVYRVVLCANRKRLKESKCESCIEFSDVLPSSQGVRCSLRYTRKSEMIWLLLYFLYLIWPAFWNKRSMSNRAYRRLWFGVVTASGFVTSNLCSLRPSIRAVLAFANTSPVPIYLTYGHIVSA